MKNLRSSLIAKIVASILAILSIGVMAISTIGIEYLYDGGLFRDGLSFYDTQRCKQEAENYAYRAYDWYQQGLTNREMASWFDQKQTNFAFELEDPQGRVVLNNYLPEESGIQGTQLIDGYTVHWWIQSPITAEDWFYRDYQLFSLVYPLRRALPMSLAQAALVFLVAVPFLFSAAGHRKGREGITLNLMDKIPLELYFGGACLLVAFLVSIAVDAFYMDSIFYVAVLAVFLTLAGAVALAFCLSLATRIKYGKPWRGTLVWKFHNFFCRVFGRMLRWCWNLLAELTQSIPLIWKTALGFVVITLVNIFFSAIIFASYSPGVGVLFFLLFNFALFCFFCYLSIGLQRLQQGGRKLAAGALDYKVDTNYMLPALKEHGENLGSIAQGMVAAVEQRMRSERLKTELITNVSHDIKTPLTSIINYVDLLGQEQLEGKAAEYLEVLDRQSKRLKKLTEDLVEASKASTGNLNVSLEPTGVCEILHQALGEYAERLEAGRLEVVFDTPEEEIYVMADGRLLWRVVDNLLSNVSKYSLAGTRVYLQVERLDGEVVMSVKNISRDRLGIDAQELMERFVRGDTARSTEGSGLGLNIARSLTELMQGRFNLIVDGDLFKVEVRFWEIG